MIQSFKQLQKGLEQRAGLGRTSATLLSLLFLIAAGGLIAWTLLEGIKMYSSEREPEQTLGAFLIVALVGSMLIFLVAEGLSPFPRPLVAITGIGFSVAGAVGIGLGESTLGLILLIASELLVILGAIVTRKRRGASTTRNP